MSSSHKRAREPEPQEDHTELPGRTSIREGDVFAAEAIMSRVDKMNEFFKAVHTAEERPGFAVTVARITKFHIGQLSLSDLERYFTPHAAMRLTRVLSVLAQFDGTDLAFVDTRISEILGLPPIPDGIPSWDHATLKLLAATTDTSPTAKKVQAAALVEIEFRERALLRAVRSIVRETRAPIQAGHTMLSLAQLVPAEPAREAVVAMMISNDPTIQWRVGMYMDLHTTTLRLKDVPLSELCGLQCAATSD